MFANSGAVRASSTCLIVSTSQATFPGSRCAPEKSRCLFSFLDEQRSRSRPPVSCEPLSASHWRSDRPPVDKHALPCDVTFAVGRDQQVAHDRLSGMVTQTGEPEVNCRDRQKLRLGMIVKGYHGEIAGNQNSRALTPAILHRCCPVIHGHECGHALVEKGSQGSGRGGSVGNRHCGAVGMLTPPTRPRSYRNGNRAAAPHAPA